MEPIHHYFEAHKALRTSVLCVLFFIASVTLFMVFTVWVFIGLPGTAPDRFQDVVFPSIILSVALICDLGITWILHKPDQRRFRATFAWVSAAVFLGMVLVSVAMIRENWTEIMKELFRHGPAFVRRG
jgi:cytochrome bd-type quinol oxidase subunit 2